MFHRATDWRILPLVVGLLLAGASAVAADEPAVPTAAAPAVSVAAPSECDIQRAGNPECISSHARPSNGPGDVGYYVGGGAPFHGQPRMADEGTWGWDYAGLFFFHRIDLAWWHGARYQGGPGQYQPDGRHFGKH